MIKQEVDDCMENKTYAVVDLETTGHSSAKGDRIIQIAIVFIKNGEIGEKYVRFVNPGQKIPTFIRQLTNISDEDVKMRRFLRKSQRKSQVFWKGRYLLHIILISTYHFFKANLQDVVLVSG